MLLHSAKLFFNHINFLFDLLCCFHMFHHHLLHLFHLFHVHLRHIHFKAHWIVIRTGVQILWIQCIHSLAYLIHCMLATRSCAVSDVSVALHNGTTIEKQGW